MNFLKDNDVFITDKDQALKFRERRHQDWTQTYLLYRDKMPINRLNQRQSVHVPLMKYTLKTLLKDIDDPPMLYFSCLDNNAQKELFYNEYWKYSFRNTKGLIKDLMDKRQVLLFGRSFKKLNIDSGSFHFDIVDPQDMLIDRYVDPSKLETARFMIHTKIYRPLSSLETNSMYDQAAVKKLNTYHQSSEGLMKADLSLENVIDENERLIALGVTDALEPRLSETYVELNECFKFEYDKDTGKNRIRFQVYADDIIQLCDKDQEELIGATKDSFWSENYVYTSWADDVEKTDFWSDSVGDSIRSSNIILDSFYSQLVENRTLRNFGMNFYDASDPNFKPQSYEPVPFGWYPISVPKNKTIRDIVQRVDIPDLSESMDEMRFILDLSDRTSAATASNQGSVEKANVTLGEVQLALANAKDRVRSMAALYTDSWEELGNKYIKLIEAQKNNLDEVTIVKTGRQGKYKYSRTIGAKDWESENGYMVEVRDLTQTKDNDIENMQKLGALKNVFPNNPVFDQIYKKKALEFASLSATEVKEVIETEKQMMNKAGMNPLMPNQSPNLPMLNNQAMLPQGA